MRKILIFKLIVFVFSITSFLHGQIISKVDGPIPIDGGDRCTVTVKYNNQLINGAIVLNSSAKSITISLQTTCLAVKVFSSSNWLTVPSNNVFGNFTINIPANTSVSKRTTFISLQDFNEDFLGGFTIEQEGDSRYVTYYLDSDGDGYGDFNAEPINAISPPLKHVTNNDDRCPNEYSDNNRGCIDAEIDQDFNWTKSKRYDVNEKLIGAYKSYFDELGRGVQTQVFDIKYKKIWASETRYDTKGRPALQTLSAPVANEVNNLSFQFNENFIRKTNGTFTNDDFENNDILNPSKVGNQPNTLGYYYSEANSEELLQDITDRPYSRAVYSELNPGTIRKSIGGNYLDTNGNSKADENEWKQAYSFSMPAAQEMYYVYGYDYFPKNSSAIDLYLSEDFGTYIKSGTRNGPLVASYIKGKVIEACDDILGYDEVNRDLGETIHLGANIEVEEGKIYYGLFNGEYKYVQITASSNVKAKIEVTYPRFILTEGGWGPDGCKYIANHKSFNENQEVLNDPNVNINWLRATKTVLEDVHGNESVLFTDSDGKTLASARSGGNSTKYEVVSLIGEQGFVDIHIPNGCENTLTFIGDKNNYKVYNLKTEEHYTTTPNTLDKGFYRIQYIGSKLFTKTSNLTYLDIATDNSVEIKAVEENSSGVKYMVNYYDYSLNYHNDIGQLTASVQPLGFDKTCLSELRSNVIHNDNLKSSYSYDVLGQVSASTSPDEGTTNFKYRNDGQIRFSQNSKQAKVSEFSYTNYDKLGRPIESGVGTGDFSALNPNSNTLSSSISKREQVFTVYDYLLNGDLQFLGLDSDYANPTFLSGNVAKTYNTTSNGIVISTTYYSYDIYGRVEWLVKKIGDLDNQKRITINYEYDHVTGQVAQVIFQKNNIAEKFVHKYSYDEETYQLKTVETVADGKTTIHADYEYYETGALKRTVLGRDDINTKGIQGIDYVYNLYGQLKAINHPDLSSDKDPGGDNNDLFGLTIDYYNEDYKRDSRFTQFSAGKDQFNGNIKSFTWNTNINSDNTKPVQYTYEYNRDNWLLEAKFNGLEAQQHGAPENLVLNSRLTSSLNAKATNSIVLTSDFQVSASTTTTFTAQIVDADSSEGFGIGDYDVTDITYDANGNIKTLKRNKNTETGSDNGMDDLEYKYKNTKPNQLDHIIDTEGYTGVQDIDNQNTGNYVYNEIGQLIENKKEKVKYEYNVKGLVTKVYYNDLIKVVFIYNEQQQRLKKITYNASGTVIEKTTDYVRDLSGNILAVYENRNLKELPIYGNSRLGTYNKVNKTSVYEIADHLGNVRAVIAKNDKGDAAALVSGTDYYPFGMPMPNRKIVNGEPYRYAYQGQEIDSETGKEAFQLRLWDARIGRWITTDPYGQYNSPYLGMGNNPVTHIDPDGGFAGTIIGAIAGGVTAAINGDSILGGMTTGAIAGAMVDVAIATGGAAAVVMAGVAGGVFDSVATDYINGRSPSGKNALISGALGGALGPFAKFVGARTGLTKVFNKVANKVITKITNVSTENLIENSSRLGQTLNRAKKASIIGGGSKGHNLASKIASNFKIFECVQCANKIVSSLKRSGISGEILEINVKSGPGVIGAQVGEDFVQVATNGVHKAVHVDGLVFDNLFPNGIPLELWKKSFEFFPGAKVSFGSTSF
ncbi:papain fold toxin domain-containing protein [Tenacibaculum sp. M341]|uniref:papain fold toxin domain-containing protein n=1 Tax=Tenacibaculum sp. M341 TaxID=2530339 RepID=UPI001050C8EB|nr:papain fold toxin domain-containing protein [Tenacibaculum sp. M341]TCI93553.1 hypothetical protein EYW44_03860 [Tenacibaculum sp. M341]